MKETLTITLTAQGETRTVSLSDEVLDGEAVLDWLPDAFQALGYGHLSKVLTEGQQQ